MVTSSTSERRRSKRTALKKCASLIINHGHQAHRIPCLILDNSQHGFRISRAFRLKRGQLVEVILDEHSSDTVRCKVMWIGKPQSEQQGEAGLEINS